MFKHTRQQVGDALDGGVHAGEGRVRVHQHNRVHMVEDLVQRQPQHRRFAVVRGRVDDAEAGGTQDYVKHDLVEHYPTTS